VTRALEVFGPAATLLDILSKDVSLEALRSLHSYDHDFAQGPVGVLQAGTSYGARALAESSKGSHNSACPVIAATQQYQAWHENSGQKGSLGKWRSKGKSVAPPVAPPTEDWREFWECEDAGFARDKPEPVGLAKFLNGGCVELTSFSGELDRLNGLYGRVRNVVGDALAPSFEVALEQLAPIRKANLKSLTSIFSASKAREVEIHGLGKATHFNGKTGFIEGWDEQAQRYLVRVHVATAPAQVHFGCESEKGTCGRCS